MNATASQGNSPVRGHRSFVVNLCASTTPVALTPPEGPEFEGFHFFVTRRREEGRDRFRLHMGHFASLAEARDKVEDLRAVYPMAWAGPAPQEAAAPEQPPVDDTLAGLSNVREVLAALDAGTATAQADVLTPAQEWSLLETGRLPEPRFAVQLASSDRPIDLEALPQPALFDVYTLYNVEGTRAGRRWYGLRLGFFNDVDAAKRVACFLKPEFAAVVVVPVTARERDCANGEPSIDTGNPATDAADPFRLEPSLLPARVGPTVAEGPAKPAPFELLPVVAPAAALPPPAKPEIPAVAVHAPPAPPPAVTKSPPGKRVMAPRRAAAPGHLSPDTATLEVLGASALAVSDERPAALNSGMPVTVAPDAPPTAPRNRQGLSKWFGRRSA